VARTRHFYPINCPIDICPEVLGTLGHGFCVIREKFQIHARADPPILKGGVHRLPLRQLFSKLALLSEGGHHPARRGLRLPQPLHEGASRCWTIVLLT